jgi:hypothetical protein
MKSNILPWAIVGVLGVLLLWSLNTESGEPIVITERHTDTLTIVKHDTVEVTKVVTTVEKEPADTVYVTVRDSIPVPIPRQEYTFSEPNMFDFRVRGYMVDFLDAKVYPKTVYETIYKENTNTITKYRSSLFIFGGFSSICGDFSPKAGISLSLKGKWLISGGISLYQKQPMYDATIGYNILHK